MKEKLLTESMLYPHGTTLTVLVDGIKAKCVMGTFGTWSDRFNLTFETEHPELGKEVLSRVTKDLADMGKAESQPSLEGRTMSMVLSPLLSK